MRVISPRVIDLSYTNIPANSEDEYSDVTSYSIGDLVQVTDIDPNKIYKSLRDSNLDNYPPDNTDPTVLEATSTTSYAVATGTKTFTLTTDVGFAPGQVVEIKKTTTPLSVSMTAEVISYTSGTKALEVSIYSVSGSGTHTNWTITSVDEIGFWEEVGATNQWKMFDEYVNTRSVNGDSIDVKLAVQRVDSVAIFDVVGTDIVFELWDVGETTKLWEGTVDLAYGAALVKNISDWYEYFFGEYSAKKECYKELGVIAYEGVLRITISATAGTDAECGNVVMGRGLDIGDTVFGAVAGILDFSYKETDADGRTTVIPGYWAKENSYTIEVMNSVMDSVYRKLANLRGIPTAWVGAEVSDYEMLLTYGIFRDFSITVAGPVLSYCQLEIEGLI